LPWRRAGLSEAVEADPVPGRRSRSPPRPPAPPPSRQRRWRRAGRCCSTGWRRQRFPRPAARRMGGRRV